MLDVDEVLAVLLGTDEMHPRLRRRHLHPAVAQARRVDRKDRTRLVRLEVADQRIGRTHEINVLARRQIEMREVHLLSRAQPILGVTTEIETRRQCRNGDHQNEPQHDPTQPTAAATLRSRHAYPSLADLVRRSIAVDAPAWPWTEPWNRRARHGGARASTHPTDSR